MRSTWEAIRLRFALLIVEQLARKTAGLRNKEFLGIDNDWTKTTTLKKLVESGLVLHVRRPDAIWVYKISSKGRRALEHAARLKALDHYEE